MYANFYKNIFKNRINWEQNGNFNKHWTVTQFIKMSVNTIYYRGIFHCKNEVSLNYCFFSDNIGKE